MITKSPSKKELEHHAEKYLRIHGIVTKMPKRTQTALREILGGLRAFCAGDQALIEELVSGEDETKKTRAALKGKDGGEIKFALGYIYALADVYDCEPAELVR